MRVTLIALLAAALALSACGSKSEKPVDTASYTCAQFNKSLATKNDNSAGNFLNQLRKKANLLAKDAKSARQELTVGVYFACRNKAGSTRPATLAIATAKRVEAGKFKLPPGPKAKKKSGH